MILRLTTLVPSIFSEAVTVLLNMFNKAASAALIEAGQLEVQAGAAGVTTTTADAAGVTATTADAAVAASGAGVAVAVFGAGFNNAANPNYGSAVFVMDLENEGKLLKNISIASTSNRPDTMVSSIPADLTVIDAHGTDKANYSGAMVYAADLGGKITKINMTDIDSSGNTTSSPTYSNTTLFSAESGTNNERYIYHEMEVTINDDDTLWLYFGTGDMQKLETKANTSNRIYGIKDKDFPNYKIGKRFKIESYH